MSVAAANTPATAPYSSASLYVGSLAPECTEANLFELFQTVGPVASVRICRDAATRRSLGYGYVNFHRPEDAERALDTMNFTTIRGRSCRIMWSHRDPSLRKSGVGNIFVKNLDPSIDNKQLYDTFSVFGNILSCKVATNDRGESLGYGFVHYESDEAARSAITSVDGMLIADKKVTVAPFKSRREREIEGRAGNFTNVYVKNLPADFTQQKLEDLFSPFGNITSSFLPTEKVMEEDSNATPAEDGSRPVREVVRCRGYGFVNYEHPEEAKASIEALHGKEISGNKLFVSRAQKKSERDRELRERFAALKLERQKKYAGVNLYVKNLSDHIDDQRLVEEFSKFGHITSARIMRDGDKSRGFGFVCFSIPEEASKAVMEMNGKMVDGKPLYVALAQRKEERRAQLEAQHAARATTKMPMYTQPRPMYYGGGMPPVMYQQMPPMSAPRWGGPGAGGPAGAGPAMGMPGGPMSAGPQGRQMMPMPYMGMMMGAAPGGPGGPAGGRSGPGGPGGRGGRGGQGPKGGKGGAGGPDGRQAPYRLSSQARNQQQQAQQQGPPGPHHAGSAGAPGAPGGHAHVQGAPQPMPPKGTLTLTHLAKIPVAHQKQTIGEQLYPIIYERHGEIAGKITGMLLEMDTAELIHLLESHEALDEKINEALQVLDEHKKQAQALQ